MKLEEARACLLTVDDVLVVLWRAQAHYQAKRRETFSCINTHDFVELGILLFLAMMMMALVAM